MITVRMVVYVFVYVCGDIGNNVYNYSVWFLESTYVLLNLNIMTFMGS